MHLTLDSKTTSSDFYPIAPPSGWNQEKDYEYASTRPAELEAWEQFPILLKEVATTYQDINELLNEVLAELGKARRFFMAFSPACLSFTEKITHIESLVETSDISDNRDQIFRTLRLARWLESERKRLVGNLIAIADDDFTYPLFVLTDKLKALKVELESVFNESVPGLTPFWP